MRKSRRNNIPLKEWNPRGARKQRDRTFLQLSLRKFTPKQPQQKWSEARPSQGQAVYDRITVLSRYRPMFPNQCVLFGSRGCARCIQRSQNADGKLISWQIDLQNLLGLAGERQPFLCKNECQDLSRLGFAGVPRDLMRAARIFVKHLAGTVCRFG
jgi:hypothetical protein